MSIEKKNADEIQAELEALKKENEALKGQNTELTEKLQAAPEIDTTAEVSVNEFLNERIPFRAFKDDNKYKDDIVVIVNGYTWQIQRGMTVMIPRYVYHAIENSERQKSDAAILADELVNQYDSRKNRLE